MTKVDQFESIFRSASKDIFTFERIPIQSILVVTDLEDYPAGQYQSQLKDFLQVVNRQEKTEWHLVNKDAYQTVQALLDLVEEHRPNLICTYRNLQSEAWKYPFSLGHYVDVLTQATTTPVLLLPHPSADRASEHALEDTNSVMAMTDHLSGDDRLVNFAMSLTEPNGTLFLSHIEDEMRYDRLMEVIAKIPSIETESARKEIMAQLLKEPMDYIESCRKVLKKAAPELDVKDIVTVGHHLSEYEKLIEDHKIDLLVMNTKDEEQLAMHGMAYPLAVEMRQIPLLLL